MLVGKSQGVNYRGEKEVFLLRLLRVIYKQAMPVGIHGLSLVSKRYLCFGRNDICPGCNNRKPYFGIISSHRQYSPKTMLQIYTLFIIMRKENIDKNGKDVKEEHPLRQGNEED